MNLSKNDLEIARIVGSGVVVRGIREALEVYHRLWAMGYRPGVPLTFWIRQKAKKKKPPVKGAKVSAMAPQYNPEQEGEGGVDHCGRSSSSKAISGG